MENRTGEIYTTNEGYKIKIIAYVNNTSCTVQFENGIILENKIYQHVIRGKIKNPLHPSVCGIGYLGVGKYHSKINGKVSKVYSVWRDMIGRCYSKAIHEKLPTYTTCFVGYDWLNFQNFAKWYEENYIEGFALDKDILFKGNKLYYHYTCCFVPHEINSIFVKCDKSRGELPIGVSMRGNQFEAKLRIGDNRVHLGLYKTIGEAFQAYKINKELYIKEVAEKWKDKITEQVYQALINYKVETTD